MTKRQRARFDPHLTEAERARRNYIRPVSSLERRMASALLHAGFAYQTERQIGPYWADFYIAPQNGLRGHWVIEVDGHPAHRTRMGKLHDHKRDSYLRAQGFEVIRFTGSEVYRSPSSCIERFVKAAGGGQS